jgi:hypothetical protein
MIYTAYRLDTNSQSPKKSQFPGPNPLLLALVMDVARIKSISHKKCSLRPIISALPYKSLQFVPLKHFSMVFIDNILFIDNIHNLCTDLQGKRFPKPHVSGFSYYPLIIRMRSSRVRMRSSRVEDEI